MHDSPYFEAKHDGRLLPQTQRYTDCLVRLPLYYELSMAEVDYVCQFNEVIAPIEVKSGTKGSMQSLYLFLKEKNSASGIRLSLENFSSLDQVDIFPIYSIQNMKDKLNR